MEILDIPECVLGFLAQSLLRLGFTNLGWQGREILFPIFLRTVLDYFSTLIHSAKDTPVEVLGRFLVLFNNNISVISSSLFTLFTVITKQWKHKGKSRQ